MSSIDRAYNEKRDFIRMKINSQVIIHQNGNDYTGICKNLSGAGMSIETEHSFAMDSELTLSIAQDNEDHHPFSASAVVTRVDDSTPGQCIIGLSIKEILD